MEEKKELEQMAEKTLEEMEDVSGGWPKAFNETKECPNCKATIKKYATKCEHCGWSAFDELFNK